MPAPQPTSAGLRLQARWPRAALAAIACLLVACTSSTDEATTTTTGAASAPRRVVAHAMGETAVEGSPRRVVVLDTPELDAALALGVTPVGAATTEFGSFPSYLETRAAGVAKVGSIGEPNLEAIAALRPDLILSTKLRDEAVYANLSRIAPTVFGEKPATWRDNLPLYAKALGQEAEGTKVLEDYRRDARALGSRLGDAAALKVSVVRFLPEEIRLYSPASFIGTVLADVGLGRPDVVTATSEIAVYIGLEQIAQADGDVIYVSTYGPDEQTQKAEALGGPLWRNLSAVKSGKVHQVPDDVWMLGIGVLGARQVLDTLSTTLVA